MSSKMPLYKFWEMRTNIGRFSCHNFFAPKHAIIANFSLGDLAFSVALWFSCSGL